MYSILLGINYSILNDSENFLENPSCVYPAILMIFFIAYLIVHSKKEEDKRLEDQNLANDELLIAIDKYNNIKNNQSIPTDIKIGVFQKATDVSVNLINVKTFIWKTNSKLCFFPGEPSKHDFRKYIFDKLEIFCLPITRIEYFSKRGEVFRENKISGGGGGGSSIGGAVVGGVLAGGAGAIIGSRKGVKEITSKLVTHDSRETFINYFDESNKRCSLFFDLGTFEIFNDLIPEKEFDIVNAIKTAGIIKSQNSTDENKSITVQLRELAQLKDDGIISEQEFSEKKKILLDKIT